MSKSVFIFETPENCQNCKLYDSYWGGVCIALNDYTETDYKTDRRCPLKSYEEAIPIEWIKDYIIPFQVHHDSLSEELKENDGAGWVVDVLEGMLKRWERENGVKMGHWVKEDIVLTSYPPQYQWHCSECGKTVHGFSDEVLKDRCPNCGIKMEKENETDRC